MYFVECDIKTLKKKHPVEEILFEFQHSGLKCAKLEGVYYPDAQVGYRSFWKAIKRNKLDHIKIHVKHNELYLVNTLIK